MLYKMKKIFCLLFLLPMMALAQQPITHTVGVKETLYSIGRMYEIHPKELAAYNNLDFNVGLNIGQVLKIPAKKQMTPPVATEPVKVTLPVKEVPKEKPVVKASVSGAPIYHTVGKKQTLYAISKLYPSITIADIKKWNNLTSDALSEGAAIIVGYGNATATTPAPEKPVVNKPADIVVQKETTKPVIEKPVVQKIEEKVKPAEVVKEVPVKAVDKVEVPANNRKATDFKGGYFKSLFDEQSSGKGTVTETGGAGIFKSTSGWDDGKYYCLHNSAAPGTIIKITNTANGKAVYAKVLDVIPDIKQNTGLIIRFSNAAADALGITTDKIDCTLTYLK
jgi:LysM repeat protein